MESWNNGIVEGWKKMEKRNDGFKLKRKMQSAK
jgi:hypothetical protein